VNVSGIIFAGNGPLKSQLFQSPFLKHYMKAAVIQIVDINYGGRFGFNEAIGKCANLLKQNELELENKLVEDTMHLMANGEANSVCIGFKETLNAMKQSMLKYVVLAVGHYQYALKLVSKDGEVKQVKFAKNEIERKEMAKSMLAASQSQTMMIEMEGFVKFWDRMCDENHVELKTVGIHSPITQQFAAGLSGCLGVLHYAMPINDGGVDDDDDDDDDDEWEDDNDGEQGNDNDSDFDF